MSVPVVKHYCRICLHDFAEVNLNDVAPSGLSFFDIFNLCTQLHANEFDGFPQMLCSHCCSMLEQSYGLFQRARDTNIHLERYLVSDRIPPPKVETTDEFEAVALQSPTLHSKDPLEDSDGEYDTAQFTGSGNDDFNEEDNIPLKYLLKNYDHSNNVNEPSNMNDKLNEDTFCNVSTLMPPDASSSVEDHIFPKGRYKCPTCDKPYFTTFGLNVHMEVHQPKNLATKKKRQRGSRSMTVYVNQEKQMTNAFGDTVSENGITKSTIKLRKEKQPKPKKAFPCPECGKHMISASKLRYHMVMHTGEKNYLCTICPKAYSTIYALKHHIRVHTGERPYECKFCGDRFLRPTTLKSHMRRHTGERPYGCNICGKRFIQHSSMTTHIKLNHKDKTIPCPHCDKKYARQTDLNTHLLSHTGDKPFACKLCPSRFIRQANLNKHMHSAHPTICSHSPRGVN